MARDETDREDLLREATALVERIELSLGATGSASAADANATESVVAGFRAGGAASFYFCHDPVYQFNAAGQFRRAYCDGLLIKASRERLVSLSRHRQEHEVQLLRHEFTVSEQLAFLLRMTYHLYKLDAALAAGRYTIVGQVPADVDVLGRVRLWLASHVQLPQIAKSPRVDS